MSEQIALSQKRMQLKRETVQNQLRAFGLPAVMDATHIVCSGGVEHIAQWALMAGSPEMRGLFGGEDLDTACEAFATAAPVFAVEVKESPGISFRGSQAVLDGVCMTIRFATRDANTGPMAYIVPVTQLVKGYEWTDHVALVPRSHLGAWMAMQRAAHVAQRSICASNLTLQCYNGPDQQIQPMALDDIIMDPETKGGFVSDITGFLSRRSWYEERRLSWTRKILLNGPPGTGKTSLARWASSELGLPAFTFDFDNPWSDSGDFRRFLSYVQRSAPAVITLDDFEKVLSGGCNVSSHAILTSFSGMASMDGIIVIGTSNSKEPFRGPMMRRWDATYNIGLPTVQYRQEYLNRILHLEGMDPTSIALAASSTDEWSFDDLRAAVTSAANFMVGRGGDSIDEGDLTRGVNLIAKRRLADKHDKVPKASMRASGQVGSADGHTHSYDNSNARTGESDGHSHPVASGAARTGEVDGHSHSVPENIRRA